MGVDFSIRDSISPIPALGEVKKKTKTAYQILDFVFHRAAVWQTCVLVIQDDHWYHRLVRWINSNHRKTPEKTESSS